MGLASATASRSCLAALKKGIVLEGTSTVSPDLGLRPFRAGPWCEYGNCRNRETRRCRLPEATGRYCPAPR